MDLKTPFLAPKCVWERKRDKMEVTIDSVSKRGIVTFTTKLELIVWDQKVETFLRNYRPKPPNAARPDCQACDAKARGVPYPLACTCKVSPRKERVLKAIDDAVDRGHAYVEAKIKAGSLNPDFPGEHVRESAEKAWDEPK
jgi:hypothetical protein